MKRFSKDNLQVLTGCAGFIAFCGLFWLIVRFNASGNATYLHVTNHSTSPVTVYSAQDAGKATLMTLGSVSVRDSEWFELPSAQQDYHFRVEDVQGKVLKDITVSREQISRERTYHQRTRGGSYDWDLTIE